MSGQIRSFLLLFFTVIFLQACGSSTDERAGSMDDPLYHAQVFVFGTQAEISIYGAKPALARQAVEAVEADFRQMHHDWHAWEPGPLTNLNRAIAEGRSADVPESVLHLIARSQEIFLSSEGRFNAGIGKLLKLWGFQGSTRPSGPPPSREAIRELLEEQPRMTDLEIKNGEVSSRNPAVQLDFGGIAKGYAVELALQRLQSLGIENAIVNAGGGLGVIGRRGERHWSIGVRHPQGEGVLASIEIHPGEQVHTSGNYERFREHEGIRYSHILDARTGWPVDDIVSCSVIHADGTLADAAATALVIAGVADWQRVANRMGIRHVMLVSEDGTVYLSPAMEQRIQFLEQPPYIVVGDGFRENGGQTRFSPER